MICILVDARIRRVRVYSNQIDSWMIDEQLRVIARSAYQKFDIAFDSAQKNVQIRFLPYVSVFYAIHLKQFRRNALKSIVLPHT